ncbi:MAG: [protein-PII] uridylyltransferase [Pseudomonadota bacterium]
MVSNWNAAKRSEATEDQIQTSPISSSRGAIRQLTAEHLRAHRDELGLLDALRNALHSVDTGLNDRFRAGESAGQLLLDRAHAVDQIICFAWSEFELETSGHALVAVGGYGRGELHPFSDIDILVLLNTSASSTTDALETFLTFLWDLGLHIGHSVRTVQECIEQADADVTVLTNLLEARLLSGDEALLASVERGIDADKIWPPQDFFQAKLEEQAKRHEKYGDTEYNLEPNVKGSPGGLRDLQLIGWLGRRHFGWRSVQELRDNQIITPQEAKTITEGQEFLWRVRYALHLIAGREEDRLLFDHQRELAKFWGFEDGDKLAVEQFMQLYYRRALALSQLNELLLQAFDQGIVNADHSVAVEPIDEHFELRNGYVSMRSDKVFVAHPAALIEVFLHAGNVSGARGIDAATTRCIGACLHLIDDDFRADEAHKALFLRLFSDNQQVTRQLRNMSRYGVLGRYLPAFGKIVGQMQFDLFHSYTVDAHTFRVIENIRRFLRPENAERFPVTSRVARRLPKVSLLYLAGLFHDIGKGRGGDHSELGAVDARVFCESHGLNDADTDLVVWLVRAHLLMSAVSQRKDISDPEVVQEFAKEVKTQNRLDYLFTLTVADINGTNPNLWNAWRGSLLRQLYNETKKALSRGLENPVDREMWVQETRNTAQRVLEDRGFTRAELEELWSERDEDYFLREKAEDIAWHTEAIASHRDASAPLVLVRNGVESSVANTTQIFIYAPFDISSFSQTCSCLEQLNLSIHDARVYHGSDGMSLDTYYVLDYNGDPLEDPERLRHIREHLSRSLVPEAGLALISPRLTPRRVRSFQLATETNFVVDEDRDVSILELTSLDRPGLLARLGEVFVEFGLICQAAKIQTLGERVEDIFMLTDLEQRAISDTDLAARIQAAICEKLDSQEAA